MLNYILADLKRLSKRVPRLLALAGLGLVAVIVIAVTYFTGWSNYNFTNNITIYLQMALPALLGLVELSAVYGDDFRAKTMQVAIGIGVSRVQVILAKLVEVILLCIVDLLVMGAVILVGGTVLGAGLSGDQVFDIFVYLVYVLANVTSFVSTAMILMFYTQSSGGGVLLYLGMCAPIPLVLRSILESLPFPELQLSRFLISEQLNTFASRLTLHIVSWGALAGIIGFNVVCFVVTALLFRKRELEF